MSNEIERKFLPTSDDWRALVRGSRHITQGYIAREKGNAVRIRIENSGEEPFATLCVKGRATEEGVPEHEFSVPLEEGLALMALCGTRVLTKRRHLVVQGVHTFEIDEFEGRLAPLILIEVELSSYSESIHLPCWVDREVTTDPRYTNAALVDSAIPQ